MWHAWGGGEMHTGFWWGDLREVDHLEDLGVDGRIITNSMEQSPSWKADRFSARQIFLHFMEAEGSLPHSQEPATCPYPESDQSSPWPHPAYWRPILILSSHLRQGLPSGLFPSSLPTKTLYSTLHTCYMPCQSHSSGFYHLNNTWCEVQIIKLDRRIILKWVLIWS